MKRNYEKLSIRQKKRESANSAFLGIFAWQRGDISEAKKYLTLAADGGTNIHQVYGALANIFLREKRYEEALYNIKKAVKLNPDNSEYYRYLKLSVDLKNNNK
jgi:tetratricopeptide (TPR) repeat protein